MTKFVLLTGGLIAVGLLGFVIDAQSRIPVSRPKAKNGPSHIYAPGRIEGTTTEIELRFELAGRVERLLVEEGQMVQSGQVLARLDNRQYELEVALTQAELASAQADRERLINGARKQERDEARALYEASLAQLKQAERSCERIRQLRAEKAVSQQEFDDHQARVHTLAAQVEAAKARVDLLEAPARADEVLGAEARVEVAKARLGLAQDRLEKTELRAPGSGQILKINLEAGELTGPDSVEPVFVMVDTSRFRVRAFVEEMDAPRVRKGMSAIVTADGLPNTELKGHVVRLSPQMTRKQIWSDQPAERFDTKTREVWIELESAETLVVGLRVDVMIDPESGASKPEATPSMEPSETSAPPAAPQPLAVSAATARFSVALEGSSRAPSRGVRSDRIHAVGWGRKPKSAPPR